jgi:hypothetical protein
MKSNKIEISHQFLRYLQPGDNFGLVAAKFPAPLNNNTSFEKRHQHKK